MSEKESYLGLHNLVATKNARSKKKRVGRGEGSGLGKTCGRGNKGQKSRKSPNVRIGFEGGQNPLNRRLPKKGFKKVEKKISVVNLDKLSTFFNDNAQIDPQSLVAAGLLNNLNYKVKVLGSGEPKNGFKLKIHGISSSAKEKIEKNGGSVEIIS